MIPEPEDKLDAVNAVSGPEDARPDWRQIDWRQAERGPAAAASHALGDRESVGLAPQSLDIRDRDLPAGEICDSIGFEATDDA